jgi:chitinase
MASVGGWTGSGPFSDMASTPASRAAFIDASLRFLRRSGFDGVDLDWEYPTAIGVACAAGVTCERPEDKRNFIALVREMRAAYGNRYLITIAAGADEKFVDGDWMAELSRSLDWINLMTYDYHGSLGHTSGLNAPIDRDPRDATGACARESVDRVVASGVPRDKITLGMPFYGKEWVGCDPGAAGDGLYQRCAKYVAEFDYADLDGKTGFTKHWNEPGRVPYLVKGETGGFITYDDERSIREKGRLVKEWRLRGAMFWELSADRGGVLRRALAEELRAPSPR